MNRAFTVIEKRIKFALLIAMSALFIPSAQASETANRKACQHAAVSFLARPGQRTFTTLVGVDETRCWPVIGSSDSNLDRLTLSAQKGNRWAAQYLAINLRRLDGGNLEDSLVALGLFSDHSMDRFLSFASDGQLSESELTNAITMLPLTLGDDLEAQLNALTTRRAKIAGVTRRDLFKQKALALKAIDDFAAEIKSKMR